MEVFSVDIPTFLTFLRLELLGTVGMGGECSEYRCERARKHVKRWYINERVPYSSSSGPPTAREASCLGGFEG